eukprot:3833706-Ditylum_brightwellii.AAC.1
MKNCTGYYFTLDKGAICSASAKQNVNSHSSAETELVVIDDKIGNSYVQRSLLKLNASNSK